MRKQKQLKEKKSNQMELEVNTSNIKSTDFSWDKIIWASTKQAI